MIKSLFEIISGQSARRNKIQRITLLDPLRRFNDSEYFAQFKTFKTLARAIAKQTTLMVASLLSDEATADWKSAGDFATPQQISDLSIFCSHALAQFTIKDLKGEAAFARLDRGLRADISDLVRLMYGDFARGHVIGGLTFDEALESRDLNDPQVIRNLTRLLDQLMVIEQVPDNSQRNVKIQKLQKLFNEHKRAFAYTLHSIL